MSLYKKNVSILRIILFILVVTFVSASFFGIYNKAKGASAKSNQVYIDYNYLMAFVNLYNRNVNTAISYYKKILPYLKNAKTYNEFANILLYAKKYDEAESFLRGAIKLFPNNRLLYEKLLDVFIIKKEDNKAIDLLKKKSSLFKNVGNIYKRLAMLYMREGNYTKALEYFKKIEGYENNKEILYYMTQCYRASGNLEKAIEYAKKLLKLDKNGSTTQMLLANLYEEAKNYSKAIEIYKNMDLKEDAKLSAIGNDYYLEGKIDKAFTYFSKAYRINPKISYAEKAAYMLMRLGKYKQVIAFINNEKVPLSNSRIRYFYGVSLMSEKKFNEAILIFKKIPPSSILYKDTLYNEVVCYNKLNKKNMAIEVLKSVKNKDKDIYYMLSDLYLQYKEYKKAIATIENNIDAFKNRAKAYFYIADIYYDKLKDKNKAVEYLKKSLKLNPDNAIVLNYLGYLLIDENIDIDKGIEFVKKALKKEPNNSYYLDSLGWGYYKKGEYKKAETFLKRAIKNEKQRKDSNDAVMYIHLAKIYIKLDNKKQAVKILKTALEKFPKNEEVKNLFNSLK